MEILFSEIAYYIISYGKSFQTSLKCQLAVTIVQFVFVTTRYSRAAARGENTGGVGVHSYSLS